MISVVLPVRNASASLPASLQSLAAQTASDFEVVAVNDGSEDNGATRAALRAMAACDSRFRILDIPHGGIVAALTAGLTVAKGTYIARMDADDLCHPRRLKRQARYLDAHPDIGLVSCLAGFGGNPQTAPGYLAHIAWANSLLTPQAIRLGAFRESPLPHPTVMFRSELLHRFGGYRNGDFPEDYELWLRWLEAGVTMAKIPETLVTWNDPPDRLSRTDPRYAPAAFHRVKAGYLARYLAQYNPHHPEIFVVGAGRRTRRRVEALQQQGISIRAWLDIDPRKIGNTAAGRPILPLSEVPQPESCFVVPCVGNRGATEDIAAFLEARGFVLGRSYLPAV